MNSCMMASDRRTVFVPLPDGATSEEVEVSTSILWQSGVFSSKLEDDDVLRLPDTITRTEFQQWIDAVVLKTGGTRSPEDVDESFSSLCTVLKVADVLDDYDFDYWVEKVLFATAKISIQSNSLLQCTTTSLAEVFVSFPEHLQHKVYETAALDKHHSLNYLNKLLHVLPRHLHPSLLSKYISPDNDLIIPTNVPTAMLPFLKAMKGLDISNHQIYGLIEHTPQAASELELHDPTELSDMEQAAIVMELSSALQHYSNLAFLSLTNLVHNAPAAALSRLPSAIASLTCLRSLFLGTRDFPVAPGYLMHLETMLQPLTHLRQLKLHVDITPGQTEHHQVASPTNPVYPSTSGKRKACAQDSDEAQDSPLSYLIRGLAAARMVSDLMVSPVIRSNADCLEITPAAVTFQRQPCRPAKAHRPGRYIHEEHQCVPATPQAPSFKFQWMSSCCMSGTLHSDLVHMILLGLNQSVATELSIISASENPSLGFDRLQGPETVFCRLKQCRQLIDLRIVLYAAQERGFGAALASAFGSLRCLEEVTLALPVEYIQQCLPAMLHSDSDDAYASDSKAANPLRLLSLTCFVEDLRELAAAAWKDMCGHIGRLPLEYLILGIKCVSTGVALPTRRSGIRRRGLGSTASYPSLPGFAALSGLTSLTDFELAGWATAFSDPQDCAALGLLQDLHSVCLDIAPPNRQHPNLVPTLSALPKLEIARFAVHWDAAQHAGSLTATNSKESFLSRFCRHTPTRAWPALHTLHVSVDCFSDACNIASRASTMPSLRCLNIGHGCNADVNMFGGGRRQELMKQVPQATVRVYDDGVQATSAEWTDGHLWPGCLWADPTVYIDE